MIRHTAVVLIALSGLIFWSGLTPAQQPKSAPPKDNDAPAPGFIDGDPTTPSDKLKEIMSAGKKGGQAPLLPLVILRGRVIAKDKPGLAVLEIGGKMYVAGKGNLLPGGVYKVKDVTSEAVTLEVNALKEIMVLR